jgi:hypothetical protein
MQEKMAKYMIEIFGDMLLTEPLANFPVSLQKIFFFCIRKLDIYIYIYTLYIILSLSQVVNCRVLKILNTRY